MKVLFYLLYLLTPLPPILLYLNAGGDWDLTQTYNLAKAIGITAFVYFAGQLYLAAKPLGLDKWLGTKTLHGFHGLMAVGALLFAVTHFVLKFFILEYGISVQTAFGLSALVLFACLIVFTLIFFANTFMAKWKWVKSLRDRTTKAWNWTYKGLRVFHNLALLVLALALSHVLLASSTKESWLLTTYMSVYLGLGALLYIVYQFRGRKGLGS